MKTVMKIILIASAVAFGASDANAQKKDKKKDQDIAYMQQKQQMDEQRNRDAELKRRNDSIKHEMYVDSLNEMLRSDSIRYSKMGAPDTINRPEEPKDSLNRDVPPRMDKGTPPKEPSPNGPNPGVRRIEFGFIGTEEETNVV